MARLSGMNMHQMKILLEHVILLLPVKFHDPLFQALSYIAGLGT